MRSLRGNFETVRREERQKPGSARKVLNYDTLRCGNCGNLVFAFWSAAEYGHGSGSIHDYRVLPWHRSTTTHPRHWPEDVGRYWVEARRSIEGMNWTAAALMARSAVQLVARKHGAVGNNLRAEIDDLADKGLLLPIMKDWSHEVRELANEGTHPQPGSMKLLQTRVIRNPTIGGICGGALPNQCCKRARSRSGSSTLRAASGSCREPSAASYSPIR